jgi:hypothetical protein
MLCRMVTLTLTLPLTLTLTQSMNRYVLFQNDSVTSMLCRMVGVLGPFDPKVTTMLCYVMLLCPFDPKVTIRYSEMNACYPLPSLTALRPEGDYYYYYYYDELLCMSDSDDERAGFMIPNQVVIYDVCIAVTSRRSYINQ